MEKLVEKIQEYIQEYGTFNIEEVDTIRDVFHNGNKITYFDLDVVKVEHENNQPEYVFYRNLNENTLLDILYVVMEWKHKWDKKLKNENNG
jgi:hypothetical protein